MKIEEIKDGNISRINIYEHRAIVKSYAIMYNSEQDRYNQICKFIEELSKSTILFRGEEKKLIKAFAEIDDRFKELYNELYPRGGYRGGGRPKGSRTDKTERLNLAVTPEEKAAVLDFLENYRKSGKLENIKEELAPYLKQIDDAFEDDEAAREKWRKRMLNVNPALYPYMLEHFKIFGIEESIAAARNQYITTIEIPDEKLANEYKKPSRKFKKNNRAANSGRLTRRIKNTKNAIKGVKMENSVHVCHNCGKIIDRGVSSLIKNLFLDGTPLPILGGYSFKESNARVILCFECYEKIKLLTGTKGNQFPGDYIFNSSFKDEKQ